MPVGTPSTYFLKCRAPWRSNGLQNSTLVIPPRMRFVRGFLCFRADPLADFLVGLRVDWRLKTRGISVYIRQAFSHWSSYTRVTSPELVQLQEERKRERIS